jgi:hypothetical protein
MHKLEQYAFIRVGQLLALLMAGLLGVVRPSQAADVMSIEFGKFAVGGLPPGFSTGLTGKGRAVAWTVLEDPSTPSGHALAEVSADTTDYRFPIAIYDDQSVTNVAVTVRFKPVAGKVDRAAGIAIRPTDPDNYYIARANALETTSGFIVWSRATGVRSRACRSRSLQIYGKSLDCVPKATSLRSCSTGRSCSRQPTGRSPGPAASRCGPRLIASPISIRW